MISFTLQDFKSLIYSDKKINVILDTDTYNEVDDQFCLAYLMRSPERINLLSCNAAPFYNSLSTGPADGMEKSYQEIFKIRDLTDKNATFPIYRGSTSYLQSKDAYIPSDACDNIVNTVKNATEPIIIVAIGAITNVASALIKCPEIASSCGVVWLGGNSLHRSPHGEFNLAQDVTGAQVLFDSGIPLLQIPCEGVCTEMVTSVPEVNYYLKGKNDLCNYLAFRVEDAVGDTYCGGRIIWDITAASSLVVPKGSEIVEIPRPIVVDGSHYAIDHTRKPYLYVQKLRREIIYADVFRKLTQENN